MPVAKSFSVDDVDNRWSFEALRTPEEQCEVAQIRLPPELDVTYDGDTGVDCLGTEMRDKLEQMAPKIADAFVRKDQKRTGAFTRRQFRDVMYSLDVPLTEAQVERVFVTFDQQNEGTLGWEKFVRAVDPTTRVFSPRGKYKGMSETFGLPPERVPLAEQLLPKTNVQHVGIPHQKREVSFGLGDPNAPMPAYSAKNSQQVAPVFKAIGKNSAYHITQDGIKPGSSLDHYERETRWVDRHQKAEKDQRKQRQAARASRKEENQRRCLETYQRERDEAEAKRQRRINAFKKQKNRYVRRMRFMDPWNNASIIECAHTPTALPAAGTPRFLFLLAPTCGVLTCTLPLPCLRLPLADSFSSGGKEQRTVQRTLSLNALFDMRNGGRLDRRYHGQDTSSAMHSTVPDGVVIADAKDAGDPFGLSQSYGETFPRSFSTIHLFIHLFIF